MTTTTVKTTQVSTGTTNGSGDPGTASSRSGWDRRWVHAVANLIIVLLLFGAWWGLSEQVRYVASPSATWADLREGFRDGWILDGLSSSARAAALGFLGACAIGIPLGYLLAVRPFFGRVMTPLVHAYGSIPRIIFLPILLVVFGVGDNAKTTMALLAAIFPIVINLSAAIAATPTVLNRLAASLEMGAISLALKVRLRGAIPALIAGMRLGLSSAILAVIISEFFGAPDGLGVDLAAAYGALDYTRLFAIVTVILVLSLGSNAVLARLERVFRY